MFHALLLLALACPHTPPVPSPAPCVGDEAAEAPLSTEGMGTGDRFVEVVNVSAEPIQLRLLDGSGQPALPGTLQIPPGQRGTFHVPLGSYRIRMRNNTSCQVQLGTPFALEQGFKGMTLVVTPLLLGGTTSEFRNVDDPL